MIAILKDVILDTSYLLPLFGVKVEGIDENILFELSNQGINLFYPKLLIIELIAKIGREAAKRGLSNITSVPESLLKYLEPASIKSLVESGVMTEKELEARVEVELEKFTMKVQIEARVLGDLAINHIVPTAIRYQTSLIDNVKGMRDLFPEGEYKNLASARLSLIKEISEHISSIKAKVHDMIEARKKCNIIEDVEEKAFAYDATFAEACVEAGVDIIDTAMSPFGFGTSQPATESMVASFQGTEYDTGIDLKKLEKIAKYFREVEKKLRKYTRMEMRIADTRVLLYQIPGGMLSNLYNQLKEMNAEDKIEDVLAEVPRVREEVGYPPLVTPLSQIVGTQAVMNVIGGERWKIVTKEMRNYIKGLYGRPPGKIKEEIVKKVLGEEKPITARPADLLKPEFEKLKKEIGDLADSDEDVLSYALFPDVAKKFLMRRKGLLNETPQPPREGKKYKIWIDGEEYFVNVEEVE